MVRTAELFMSGTRQDLQNAKIQIQEKGAFSFEELNVPKEKSAELCIIGSPI